jgi:hypothetical protein
MSPTLQESIQNGLADALVLASTLTTEITSPFRKQDLVVRCRECIAVLTNMIIAFAETTGDATAAK